VSTAADCKPRLMRFLSQRSAEMGLGVLVALAILLRLQPLLCVFRSNVITDSGGR
jgi:hypothetical protein